MIAGHCGSTLKHHRVKSLFRHLHAFSEIAREVQEIQTRDSSSLLEVLKTAHGSTDQQGERLARLSEAWPTILTGLMTDQGGWRALSWTLNDLTSACDGDTYVPVEVSTDNGDYRDLHRSVSRYPERTFEAGVPVPLSFLAENMQLLEPAAQQVYLTQTLKQVSSRNGVA